MTETENTTVDPWSFVGGPYVKPSRIKRITDYFVTAAQILSCTSLGFSERLAYLDQRSPEWTWALRNWWRENVRHRQEHKQARERHARTLAYFDVLIEREKTDEQFWLIVNDPNY